MSSIDRRTRGVSSAIVRSELVVQRQGPPFSEKCTPLIQAALDVHFYLGKKWPFFRTPDHAEKLKFHRINEIVDLIGSEKLRVTVAL